jgi:methyl-accepting chemotaxis protein
MASAAQVSIVEGILADSSQAEKESAEASSSASSVVMTVRMVDGMMGEMIRGIAEVGSHVNESQQRIVRATSESNKTLERVTVLSRAVDEIASTAHLIDRIANETNMLALNATIEAARAGASGKGFAVVASEVKSLSKQTAQATEGVHLQLATIRQANQEVVAAVGALNEDLSGIHTKVEAVATAVKEYNSCLGTVANYAKEAADTVEGIAGTLDRIAAAARSTSEKIRQLNTATSI